jgi:hypothetical protein
VETAIDVLPTFTDNPETPSQGASQTASQKPVVGGLGVALAVTLPAPNGVVKPIKNKGESHDLEPAGMGCHKGDEWREWRGSNP